MNVKAIYQCESLQKMQANKKHYQISTKNLLLAPYKKCHVKEYNSWFTDSPQLLHLTGSQLLTLQQQYQNHTSWLQDPTKYTFLIFTKPTNKPPQMIGDINLFFSEWIQPNQAEINIMIAVKEQRGKGYAAEALEAVESFGRVYYEKDQIIAKIKKENEGSLRLFQKMGYAVAAFSEHFQEEERRKKLDKGKQHYQKWLQDNTKVEEITNLQQLYSL